MTGAGAQSGNIYRNHSAALTSGGGDRASANYRIHDDAAGLIVSGVSTTPVYGLESGFVTDQAFDFSAPSPAFVRDGRGFDLDEIVGDANVCANWLSTDAESGIFGGAVGLGTSPGLADVFPLTPTPYNPACLPGPFEYCRVYYFTAYPRNGSGLYGPSGTSDGFYLDDAIDSDSDGDGNACDDDDDGDGIADFIDPCPCDPLNDADSDGVCASQIECGLEVDNCPNRFNPSQADSDSDGLGDACDDIGCALIVDQSPGVRDCASIQACLDVVTPGCSVVVRPGLYEENLTIGDTLSLIGSHGAAATTVQGVADLPVIEIGSVADDVRIESLTLTGGSTGVLTSSNVTLAEIEIHTVQTGIHATVSVQPGGPRITLARSRVRDVDTAVRVDTGNFSLLESWVSDTPGNGIEVNSGHLYLRNSLITGSANRGLLLGTEATAEIWFATITDNAVGIEHVDLTVGGVSVANSIIYGNTNADLIKIDCASVFFTDTDPACCAVNGNLCEDPDFQAPSSDDYHLDQQSPCIDAGFDPAAFLGIPPTDHDGNLRLLDADFDGFAHPDCGAYELDLTDERRPSEVQNVLFDTLVHFTWDAEPFSDHYRVYRGNLSALGYDYVLQCVDVVDLPEKWLSQLPPPPGDGWVYLVSGLQGNSKEGTLGFGTTAERSNFSPCP
jgi:hypothetical protein